MDCVMSVLGIKMFSELILTSFYHITSAKAVRKEFYGQVFMFKITLNIKKKKQSKNQWLYPGHLRYIKYVNLVRFNKAY